MMVGVESLSRVIFLSNAIPKSGSTLLFSLQAELLRGAAGLHPYDYDFLDQRDFPNNRGFVADTTHPDFVAMLEDGVAEQGPILVKLHARVEGALLEAIASQPGVAMSLILRDPIDVVLSARDHFRNRGQFHDFRTLERGILTANTTFRAIFRSAVRASQETELRILRYEDLLVDPTGTTLASLPPWLYDLVSNAGGTSLIDYERARRQSRHQLHTGALRRDASKLSSGELALLTEGLAPLRREMGYGNGGD